MTKTCTASDFAANQCECLDGAEHPVTVTLGLILLLGNIVFVLQVFKIRRRESTVGISVWMVTLHCWFNWMFLLNYVALSYYQLFPCCQNNDSWFCFCSLLAFLSQVLVVVLVHTILATFVWYHKPTEELGRTKLHTIWSSAVIIEAAALGVLLVLSKWYGVYSRQLQTYGDVCAGVSCVVVSLQWIPQIWTSCKLGRVGSLSVLMTMTQAIGGVASTLNFVFHSSTEMAWISQAFNTFMIAVLMLVLFRIWVRQKRGLSFMFSFMLSAERRAELEEEFEGEISDEGEGAREQHSTCTDRESPERASIGQTSSSTGRSSAVQLRDSEQYDELANPLQPTQRESGYDQV